LRDENEKIIPFAIIAEIRQKAIIEKSMNSDGLSKAERIKLQNLNQCELKKYL
jgi:hypothetical protein